LLDGDVKRGDQSCLRRSILPPISDQPQESLMTNPSPTPVQPRWRDSLVAVAIALALGGLAAAAHAGECPADKRVADGKGQPPGPSAPVGVSDRVRASTDLSKEPLALAGRQFRLRQLEMQPGGVVPWHSHNERPAMIYIVAGEVVEYASNCAVPIVHRSGDVAPEKNGTSHWWKNTGSTPAVLISVDLFPSAMAMDPHAM
jgi:quercetin dioxygenase-like cupin family protein